MKFIDHDLTVIVFVSRGSRSKRINPNHINLSIMTKCNRKMVSLIIAAPIFLFISKSVSSQDKWFKFGTAPQLYENFIDSSNPHQGRGAMTLKSFDTTINGFGTLAQMMRPGKYLDKRVRMTGYLKSKDAIGWAGFWFRVDQSGSQALLSFDNMED